MNSCVYAHGEVGEMVWFYLCLYSHEFMCLFTCRKREIDTVLDVHVIT